MKYEKQQIENNLYSYALGIITDYGTGIKQTTNNVWGKDIRRTYKNDKNEYLLDINELENWYIDFNISANAGCTALQNLIQQLKESCYEKDCGNIPLKERRNYTCYQLCNWSWLTSEDGFILKERKNVKGEIISYYGTIVKYAKILKNFKEQK